MDMSPVKDGISTGISVNGALLMILLIPRHLNVINISSPPSTSSDLTAFQEMRSSENA